MTKELFSFSHWPLKFPISPCIDSPAPFVSRFVASAAYFPLPSLLNEKLYPSNFGSQSGSNLYFLYCFKYIPKSGLLLPFPAVNGECRDPYMRLGPPAISEEDVRIDDSWCDCMILFACLWTSSLNCNTLLFSMSFSSADYGWQTIRYHGYELNITSTYHLQWLESFL